MMYVKAVYRHVHIKKAVLLHQDKLIQETEGWRKGGTENKEENTE